MPGTPSSGLLAIVAARGAESSTFEPLARATFRTTRWERLAGVLETAKAHGAPAGTVLEVFRRLDLNEDGRIDREEFLKIPTGVEPGISSWFESVFDEAGVS